MLSPTSWWISFVYLESIFSRNVKLNAVISWRIAKASFGNLEKRVCSDGGIITNTKLGVYEAFVLTVLLLCFMDMKHGKLTGIKRFHQSIRRILKIEWRSRTHRTDRCQSLRVHVYGRSIEKRLILNQMRWAGHVVRMEMEGFQNNSFIVS